MEKTHQYRTKFLYLLMGMGAAFGALAIIFYFPDPIEYWKTSLNWLCLGILLLVSLSPLGNRLIGKPAAKKPLGTCIRQIVFSYFIILVVLFSILILFTTTVMPIPLDDIWGILNANVSKEDYLQFTYPWITYILAVILIGGVGYKAQSTKLSGALSPLSSKMPLTGTFVTVIDSVSVLGFYISLLVIIALASLALVKAVSFLFGYPINFDIDLPILGVAFALVYLPLSTIWKTAMERLKNFTNVGWGMLIIMVSMSVFVLAMYGILVLFFQSFSDYFASMQTNLPPMDISFYFADLQVNNALWSVSLVSMVVVGSWWAQILQGYTWRLSIAILMAPLLIAWLVYQIIVQNNLISLEVFNEILLWCWNIPQVYVFALLGSIILITALWRENYFVKGIITILPETAHISTQNWGNLLGNAAQIIVGIMMLSLLTGMFFVKTLLLVCAVLFSLVLMLAMISIIKLIFIGKSYV